jgi:DNA primase
MAGKKNDKTEGVTTEVSVQRLAESVGVVFTFNGSVMVGKCPFHDDAGTAFTIDPKANTWRCDVCAAGGSVVEFVMKSEGVSRRHALELLAQGLPLQGNAAPGKVKGSSIKKLPAPVQLDADDQKLLRDVVDYYNETLKQSPEGLAYLESRGLRSGEAIDHFKLGYANRTLGYRLPDKNRRLGQELRGRLTKLGIYRESGHEHMSGSLVIPVFDQTGNVLQLYGRKVTPRLRPGTPLHLYLPGEMRGVWNIESLVVSKTIILAPSLIDALSFWCAGHMNVTSLLGGTLHEDLIAALRAAGTKTVLLAFRRDAEGDKLADAIAGALVLCGVGCYRVQFPAGMDANDYARTSPDPQQALGQVLRRAMWLGKGRAPELEVEAVVEKAARKPPRAQQEPLEAPVAAATQQSEPDAHSATQDGLAPVAAVNAAVASPEPPPPAAPEVPAEVSDEEVVIRLGARRYRVRGLARNMSYDTLRVNLLVTLDEKPAGSGPGFHADTFDLYSARHRVAFVKQAAVELGVREESIKQDLGKVLLRLEQLQEEQIRQALEPKRKEVVLAETDRAAALDLLRDAHLVDRILADFQTCGVVGEQTNILVAYLATVSRKLDDPLAVIIQSSSAAGKTSLMEAILAFVPEEDRLHFSAMTGQALYYRGEQDVAHRILAIAEEEGAARASYALKLLQSEGKLTIASTGKDPTTGRLVAQEYRVQGPVMLLLTTTAIDLDEELLNRCVVLTVDEDREQTRAIHRLQRERQTLQGLLARRDRDAVLKLHRDAQRLVRPLLVANSYALELTFLDDRTRTRRDHGKYLCLIRAIALLHQHQRPVKRIEHAGHEVEYIEVELADIALANKLAHQVLGRSLDDVPPQARHLLQLLDHMVTENCTKVSIERSAYRFGRRDIRAFTGWSDFQVRSHIEKLVALEYVLVHRGGRGQLFSYELLYDGRGQDGGPFLVGLLDAEKLARAGDGGVSSPPAGESEHGSRSHRGVIEAPSGPAEIEEKPNETVNLATTSEFTTNTTSQETTSTTSYPQTGEGTS